MKCPLCSSKLVINHEKHNFLYGETSVSAELTYGECISCKERINIPQKNSKIISNALSEARINDTVKILEDISKRNSLSNIERALRLPQRTLSKWKTREVTPSASASVLLEFIHLFPWLIDIADSNFDKKISNTIAIDHICSEEFNISGNYCFTAETHQKLFAVASVNKRTNFKENDTLPFNIGGLVTCK